MKRYVRNIAIEQIDIEGQTKLNKSTALVIGAGGLGCHLLYHLASLGFKNIVIMDKDTVSISNLQRQILFNEKSVGKNKALEASNTLQKYNSEISIYPIQEMFTSLKQINEHLKIDIIFDCSDNYETRKNISQESKQFGNIPVIFSAVGEFEGWVFTQFYQNELNLSFEDLISPHKNDQNCDSLGVVSPSVSFVSSVQAMEGLKYILNLNDKQDKYFNINCFNYQVTEMEIG